ncbi:hypothetical protein [Mesobacillus subterraneus]|uniref:Uncharacterized protein n=1 Tax=Mesobacillus subterraneus TaxID=285983 RepID=A0A427TGX1_9BACI|nr:hypothetical protein [Mesobacillus subterraneus]RSD22754.1 hypothetical protein EJA10_20970 [Mesobacillus subterraneus]
MLPEHYCNYLLNMYMEGADQADAPNKSAPPSLLGYILLGFVTLSGFLFYFTELSLFLQMTFIAFFGIVSILSAFYLVKKSFLQQVPLLSAALLFLISSVEAVEIIFPGKPILLYAVTGLNCLLWIAAGMKLGLISFKLSGFAGLLVLLIIIFI